MKAAILSVGAVTPIGMTAGTTAAAWAADVPNHRMHPFFVDDRGQEVLMAYLDAVTPLAEGERMAMLAAGAVDEAVRALPGGIAADLLLALPSPRPGIDAAVVQRIVAAVRAAAEPKLTIREVRRGHHDHAGGVMALGAALARAAGPEARASLVVAADSLIGPDALDWLTGAGRLFSTANPFGPIPGEAAAAVLVGPPSLVQRVGLAPFAALVGYGETRETADKPPGPWLGRALSEAIGLATDAMAAAGLKAGALFPDLTPEPWRADTLGMGLVRVADRFELADGMSVLANRTGDIGAAHGVVSAIVAGFARRSGALAARHACVVGMGAATGARAAVLIDLGEEG
ncbi:MAG: hypothetical protein ACKVPY_00810 [Paracoccaceae bacterium]